MSKIPLFERFLSVGNLKPKLKWFFKPKLKPKFFYWIGPQVLDLDGDGKLSKSELRAAIERVVGLSTFEGQDALLNMVMEAGGDADKDGNITIDELNAL